MFGLQKRGLLSSLVLLLLCSELSSCSLAQPKSGADLYAKYNPTLIVKILVKHKDSDARVTAQLSRNKVSSISKQLSRFPELERPNISRDDFVKIVVKALQAERVKIVSASGMDIIFLDQQSNKAHIFLDNIWSDCRDNPGKRTRLIQRFLDAFISGEMLSESKGKSDIVPIVRSTDYLEGSMAQIAKDSRELAAGAKSADSNRLFHLPIAPGIVCMLAEDAPNSMTLVSETTANQLKIAESDIKNELIKNLESRLPDYIEVYSLAPTNVYALQAGGDYESSLILNDTLMAKLQAYFRSPLVFSVPSRETVFFAPLSKEKNISAIKEGTRSFYDAQARKISPSLYTWNDGKISEYEQ